MARNQMIRRILTNIEQLQILQNIILYQNHHSKIHNDKAIISKFNIFKIDVV